MIQPIKLMRGKTTNAYMLVYNINRWHQQNWRNHLLNEASCSIPCEYPWECLDDYMDWFIRITHSFVQVLSLRTTPRIVQGGHRMTILSW